MPAVNVLIKPASSLCNMHCDYCFYHDEAEKREQYSYGLMSRDTALQVIQKTLRFADGACAFAFQGGEPTLCGPEFFRFFTENVKKYNTKNVRVSYALQTNGYALNEEWAELFAENHFLLGVSVDGTRVIHDKYRHYHTDPTYDHILEKTKLLDRYKVDYNILTVVTRDTAEYAREIYRSYKENNWRYMQFIACLDPYGEERGKYPWSLLPQDYGRFLTDLFDCWYHDLVLGDAPYIRQFDNYIGILLGVEPESCEQRGLCAVQNVIEADGSVYPCDFFALDEYRLGNLNEDEYAQIYARRRRIQFIERSYMPNEKCRSCRYAYLCRGGCFRHREEPGRLNYFCEAYEYFFRHCEEKMRRAADIIRRHH